MFLIKCYILFVFQIPFTFAAWKCDCEPRFEDPPDMDRLGQVMVTVDPLAEWKYHFDCTNVPEPVASTDQLPNSPGEGLRPCEPDSEASTSISWLQDVEKGFNFVTGYVIGRVLDLRSTNRYNATFMDPLTNRCHAAPDALVSPKHQPPVAVTFNRYATHGFRAVAVQSFGYEGDELRKKMVKSRKVEFELDSKEYPGAVKAAFSKFKSIKGVKAAEAQYLETTHQVFIQTPVPSDEIINKWSQLSETDYEDYAFWNYIQEYGTHYTESAALGGEIFISFPVHRKRDAEMREDAVKTFDAQKWTNCAATVISKNFGFSVAGTSCSAGTFDLGDYSCTNRGASGKYGDYINPCNETDSDSFRKWSESLKKGIKPVALNGQRRWITHLVDIVIQGANNGVEVYKEVVDKFGGYPPKPFEENLKRLEKLKGLLTKQLSMYLDVSDYCKYTRPC